MNFVLDKVSKLSNFLGVNGPGPSTQNNAQGINGSWFAELLAWLADAVVKIATVVWGWLITLFYFVIRFCLNLIDILQMFVEKLVGIEVYNQEGGLSAVKKLEETDLIIRFITNDKIIKTFGTICVLGLILLVIFSIIALVRQNYNAAITDGADGAKKGPREVLKYIGRAVFMCLLVPFLVVFGILGSNAVLASVCNAIRGDNKLTIGGIIYTASAYEANKFREYANDGVRVPIMQSGATEVVVPSDYREEKDMQVLFYKLAKGTVYIESITDSAWFKEHKPNYSRWVNELEVEDINVNIDMLTGSEYFRLFKEDFNDWYKEFFSSTWGGRDTLAELGMLNEHINSIYKTNWTANKKYIDKTYDFSSTYKPISNNSFSVIGKDKPGVPGEILGYNATIYVNSSSYVGHENFAPIELEYYVMADVIDFAVEQSLTLYYVNANNNMIKWSDIDLDPEDEDDEIIDIREYNAKYYVAEKDNSVGGHEYITGGHSKNGFEETKEYIANNYTGYTLLADSAFIVRYHTGVNRLYWSTEGATSENEGATFIVCFKMGDDYIPVTQETTKFSSAFLAPDYSGPVVARGIFQKEDVIPKDYCLPTAITEQVVDASGRELVGFDKLSPFSLLDTYDPSVENTALSKVEGFVGTLSDLTGGYLWRITSGLSHIVDSGVDAWEKWLTEDLIKALNEDDVASSWSDYVAKTNEENRKFKTSGGFETAQILLGSNIRTGNLLVNPNIAGFAYDNKENPSKVTFYDNNGRKIAIGGVQGSTTEIPLENGAGGSSFDKHSYLVLQMSRINDVVIPWYFADATTLDSVIDAINNDEALMKGNKKPTYLIVEYTYDNIQMKLDGTLYRMLLNFNVQQIYEVRRDAENIGDARTSGEFIVLDEYNLPGFDVVVEKRADLVVSGGEIFYANGEMFFGREDAKKLYTDFFENYIKDLFSDSIQELFDNNSVGRHFVPVMTEILFHEKGPDKEVLDEFLKKLAGTEENALDLAWDYLYDNGADIWGEQFEDDPDNKKTNEKIDVITKYIMSIFSAGDYRAGLASYIKDYGKAYYTTEESYKTEEILGVPIRVIDSGIIKFYDPNNKETGSSIEYNQKQRIENNKIIIKVDVVSGAGANANLISYASVVSQDEQADLFKFEKTDGDDRTLFGKIIEKISGSEDTYKDRLVWSYDITYSFSYDEYSVTDGADTNVVGVYGMTIDGVNISFKHTRDEDNASVTGDGSVPPQNLLRVRNGGVYCDVLGKYILTPEGAMRYIVNMVESNGEKCVKNKFTQLLPDPTDPSVMPDYIDTEIKTNEISGSKLASITADTINIESRSEYNNIYTYFVRGDFDWTMLFDFCIHLPVVEFSPKIDIDFAFRFKLGTSYNYAEKVIWRLQGGSFYLDYNFRNAVGIGQENLFRMSAINPFLLIFSTVLVMSILWTTVWGLIKRIYEIVLMFLMLPAVCATMPVDEGSRFGKWTKEILDKIFSAYSVLIMLNLYFVLIPIIKDVTSDLITMGDIPHTITGMFGTISAGIQSFGGFVSGIGTKLTGAISNVGGRLGNLIGSVGMNNFILAEDTEVLTNAQQVLLGHVNSIIYLMFFLVLTTLLRGGGQNIFKEILGFGELDSKVEDAVKKTASDVVKSNVVQVPKAIAKTTGQLLGNGLKFTAGAVAGFVTQTPLAAKAVWSTMEKPEIAKMGDMALSTDGEDSSSGTALAGDSGAPVEGTGEGGSSGGGVGVSTTAYGYGGGGDYAAAVSSASGKNFAGYAEGVKSRFDNHGEAELDESYMRAAKDLDGMSEQEINEYIIKHGNHVKDKIFNMAQWRPAEGVLPEGMPRMTYEEYLNAIKNAPDEQTREKLEQVRYAYDGITDQTYKTFKEEGFYQVTDAHHYKEIRRQNEAAEARREATIRREEQDRAGMTEEQKEQLDAMFRDRASLFAAKDLIDSTYTGVERRNAHEEVDAEIRKINRNIDEYMAQHSTANIEINNAGQAYSATTASTAGFASSATSAGSSDGASTLSIRLGATPEQLGKMKSHELREYTNGVLEYGERILSDMKRDGTSSKEAIKKMENDIKEYKGIADEFVALREKQEGRTTTINRALDNALGEKAKEAGTQAATRAIQVAPQRTVVVPPPPKVISNYGGVMTAQAGSKSSSASRSQIFVKNAVTLFADGPKGMGSGTVGYKVGQLIRSTIEKQEIETSKEVEARMKAQAKDAEYQARIGELENEIKGLTAKVAEIEKTGVKKSKVADVVRTETKKSNISTTERTEAKKSNVADKIKVDHTAKMVDEKIAKLDSKINNLNTANVVSDGPEVTTETSVRVTKVVKPGESMEKAQKEVERMLDEKMAEAKKIAESMPDQRKVSYEKPAREIKRNASNAKKIDDFWEKSAAPEMVAKQGRPKSSDAKVKKTVKIKVDMD